MTMAITTFTNDGLSNGAAIYHTHLTRINDKLNSDILPLFNTAMTGKLVTVAAQAGFASFRIQPQTATPTTLSAGDIWNAGTELRFYTGTTTKTLAFTDTEFATLNTTGNVTFGGTLTVASTTNLNAVTTIAATNATAFTVRRASSGTILGRFNTFDTNTYAFELLNGAAFRVFGGDGVSQRFAVESTGTTVNGPLTASSTLAVTGNATMGGTLNVTGAISRNNVAYATPAGLNTGGFTINLGNGTQAISAGAQLPTVTIPYACTANDWYITTNDTASTNLTGVAISLTWEKRTAGAGSTQSFTTLASGPTMALTSAQSQAQGTFTGISFAAGDTLRLVAAATPTAKAVSVFVRVTRT